MGRWNILTHFSKKDDFFLLSILQIKKLLFTPIKSILSGVTFDSNYNHQSVSVTLYQLCTSELCNFPFPSYSCPLWKIDSAEHLRLSAVDIKSKRLFLRTWNDLNQSAVTVVVFISETTESKVGVDQMRSRSGPDRFWFKMHLLSWSLPGSKQHAATQAPCIIRSENHKKCGGNCTRKEKKSKPGKEITESYWV